MYIHAHVQAVEFRALASTPWFIVESYCIQLGSRTPKDRFNVTDDNKRISRCCVTIWSVDLYASRCCLLQDIETRNDSCTIVYSRASKHSDNLFS